MLWKGIAHTAYAVSDMQTSLNFYVGKLGFQHAFSISHPQTGKPWIEYIKVANGQFIELFYTNKPLNGNSTYRHLCLETVDAETTARELKAAGIVLDVEPKQGNDKNIQLWIHDPDGNPIEIMQISPDSPQANS